MEDFPITVAWRKLEAVRQIRERLSKGQGWKEDRVVYRSAEPLVREGLPRDGLAFPDLIICLTSWGQDLEFWLHRVIKIACGDKA